MIVTTEIAHALSGDYRVEHIFVLQQELQLFSPKLGLTRLAFLVSNIFALGWVYVLILA
jgi:hypothetical protein